MTYMPGRAIRKRNAKSGDIQSLNDKRFRLKKHKFIEVTGNNDFVTAVRIGRVLNALHFSRELVLYDYDMTKSKDRRRWSRVLILNAAYLHEALRVFESVESKYATRDFFKAALILTRPDTKEGELRKKVLKYLRDAGFHLDSDDKVTSSTLLSMAPDDYILFSNDDGTIGNFHFDLADNVDLYSWVEAFRESKDQTTLDVLKDIISDAIIDLGREVVKAGHDIFHGLIEGLNLTLTPPKQGKKNRIKG